MDQRQITYQDLVRAGACSDYREKFAEMFGTGDLGIAVTVEMAVTQAAEWDWDFAAHHFLSYEGTLAWEEADVPVLKKYREDMTPYWRATEEAYPKSRQAFDAVIATWVPSFKHEFTPNSVLTVAQEAATAVMEESRTAEKKARERFYPVLSETRARVFAEIYIREGQGSE